MFVDEIKVYARSGHGGKGAVAFTREAYRPKGGPSGGNGGRGGSVILEADHDLNNLIGQFYKPRLIADDGDQGGGKGMDGLAGKDLIVKVPCGTLVWKLPPPPATETEAITDSDGYKEDMPADIADSTIPSAIRQRDLIRHSGRDRAVEVDLAAEEIPEREPKQSPARTALPARNWSPTSRRTASASSSARADAAGWATVISPPPRARPRVSPNPARPATKATTVSSCAPSPTWAWSVILTRENRRCSVPSRAPARRSPRIHLPRSRRRSASSVSRFQAPHRLRRARPD